MTPYAEVIGDPITQSKSPLIHKFWLDELGLAGEYRRSQVAIAELDEYLRQHRADAAWRGSNVTMPLKRTALALADRVDGQAAAVGAANLLSLREGELVAGNTDVAGILDALPTRWMGPGAQIVLIGTGGAARAVFAALQERNIRQLQLCARDEAAGRALLEEFTIGGDVHSLDRPDVIGTADVVINATPLGMSGYPDMPEGVIEAVSSSPATVFDMIYHPVETRLLKAARDAGLHTADGLQMLVGQAATAFERFFGQPAPREKDAELRQLLLA